MVVCQAPPSTEYSVDATPEVASVAETETPTLEVYQPSSPVVPVSTGVLMTGGVWSMWIVWLMFGNIAGVVGYASLNRVDPIIRKGQAGNPGAAVQRNHLAGDTRCGICSNGRYGHGGDIPAIVPSAGGAWKLAVGGVMSSLIVLVVLAVFPALSWACTWTV